MLFKYIFASAFWYFLYQFDQCNTERVTYIETERPKVTYLNPLFIRYAVMTSRRIDRKDPRHYVNIFIKTLIPLDNNLKMDFYFYQLLTNVYKPSFIEFHFGVCDLIDKEPLFGAELKRRFKEMNVTCPYPAMQYNFTMMRIPFVPKNFPFEHGRIYCNLTYKRNKTTFEVGRAYIDMELKQMHKGKH